MDLTALQRRLDDLARTDLTVVVGRVAGGLQRLPVDLAEDLTLPEAEGADDDLGRAWVVVGASVVAGAWVVAGASVGAGAAVVGAAACVVVVSSPDPHATASNANATRAAPTTRLRNAIRMGHSLHRQSPERGGICCQPYPS